MTAIPQRARILAGCIALVGFAGLAIRFGVSLEATGSASAALWAMLRFFTIIGNLVTACILAAVALGRSAAFQPVKLGGITLTMLLIGVVYALLLRNGGQVGAAYVANVLMHYVMPPLVVFYWLLCAPKGQLSWRYPVRWAAFPFVYFGYALVRGVADGKYPYPFIDVTKLGWPQTLINAALIALGFLLVGYALVWIDRRLGGARSLPFERFN